LLRLSLLLLRLHLGLALLPLRLLLGGALRDLDLRMHLLHLGQVAVHEVAEKDLAVQLSPRIRQLYVGQPINGALVVDTETRPVVVDVRAHELGSRIWRQTAERRPLLAAGSFFV
jgi:hypothetical protein